MTTITMMIMMTTTMMMMLLLLLADDDDMIFHLFVESNHLMSHPSTAYRLHRKQVAIYLALI